MTFSKRLRAIWAACMQEWHQKRCCECGARWMAVGPLREELISVCDECEVKNLNLMMAHSEREYQRLKRMGVI